jgi:hypothetical protein
MKSTRVSVPLALLERKLMFDWREMVEVYILTEYKSLIESEQ